MAIRHHETVQSTVIPKELDSERVNFYNFRLNVHGRRICSRVTRDNPQSLLTTPAFTMGRSLGLIHVVNVGEKKHTRIDEDALLTWARETVFKIVPLNEYPLLIAELYNKPDKISFRSKFYTHKFFETLNSYGHNRDKKLPHTIVNKILDVLNSYLLPWISRESMDFDMLEELKSGRWLSHIKTNSNSGYPSNIKQTKELMIPIASTSLKLFNSFRKGERINWYKLPFQMGFRTERDDKIRVVCMAPEVEKPISAVGAVVLDESAKDLPFNMPRKFGPFTKLADAIFDTKLPILCKDFSGFDTSIPIHFLMVLRDWFKSINNTFSWICAFECDMMINSVMIINPSHGFNIFALPSGIGFTQFIGSIIHWIIDHVVDLVVEFAVYQADDVLETVNLTMNELNKIFKEIFEIFGMTLSPVGEKSTLSDYYGIILQKVIDRKQKIFYNHEPRAITNALFRERQLTEDNVFDELFSLDTSRKDGQSKKAVLSYLGNLSSFGENAPSLHRILAFLTGKSRSGFTRSQVEWGLHNLEPYIQGYLAIENHRPVESPGWCKRILSELINEYNWKTVTPSQVAAII